MAVEEREGGGGRPDGGVGGVGGEGGVGWCGWRGVVWVVRVVWVGVGGGAQRAIGDH